MNTIKNYVDETIAINAIKAQGVNKPGWFGWGTSPSSLLEALLEAVKDMTRLVGPEERQAILDGAGALYDKVISPALPLYLKPFSSLIRKAVVNVVLTAFLNFLAQDNPTGIAP